MTEALRDTPGSKDEVGHYVTQHNAPLDICPIKLDGSNYLLWSRSFTLAITANGLLKFIMGPVPPPAAASPEFVIWTTQNAQVMTWLFNSMMPTIRHTY